MERIMVQRINLEKALQNAARRTINKLITRGRSQANRQVRQTYNIKAKDLNRFTKVRRATSGRMEASITISGRKMPIILFSASQVKRGVTVRIKKASGRKTITGAFITGMPSGHRGVWRRKGKERLPIKELYTASPAEMFENEGAKAFNKMVEKEGGNILQHEIDYELSKFK
jgi:hypothetical protein